MHVGAYLFEGLEHICTSYREDGVNVIDNKQRLCLYRIRKVRHVIRNIQQ